jgi:hypothetical protein
MLEIGRLGKRPRRQEVRDRVHVCGLTISSSAAKRKERSD